MIDPKGIILQYVKKNGAIRSRDVVRLARVSRQSAARYLRELVFSGELMRLHSTRKALYISAQAARPAKQESPPAQEFRASYSSAKLSEEPVFRECALRLGLKARLARNAYSIVHYAFTEMLNNAIEHSQSKKVHVHMYLAHGALNFVIIDRGIGAFANIRSTFKLASDFEAVEHLLKGKQTTDPARHSGQGIFFTSKIADRFTIESARLRLLINNAAPDTFLHDVRKRRGTFVSFSLRRHSRKNLKDLFEEYSKEEYEFDTTRIAIKLTADEEEHISRSQARRLLFGLDQFKHIILDFSGVRGIGQAFADEIFRVFKTSHPRIKVEASNMSPAVTFMVERTRVKKPR